MPTTRDHEISADDLERARSAWRRDTKPQWRNLLDAEPAETPLDERDIDAGVMDEV